MITNPANANQNNTAWVVLITGSLSQKASVSLKGQTQLQKKGNPCRKDIIKRNIKKAIGKSRQSLGIFNLIRGFFAIYEHASSIPP
jgi:hypothetical protein